MSELKYIEGLTELREAMLQLPKRLDRRVLNASLMAGARLIAGAARGLAPELQPYENGKLDPRRRPGTLRRNITARPIRPRPGASATVGVYVRKLSRRSLERFKNQQWRRGQQMRGADNPNDPFYWRFVEFGTRKMAARPFLRPAFQLGKDAAIDLFRQRMTQRLVVEARKLNKGPKR